VHEVAHRWWPTATEIADSVRAEVRGGTPSSAMRLLMDGINYLPDAAAHDDLAGTLAEPPSTGDVRWDTLLAAAIRYRLRIIGVPAPAWTYKPPLAKLWWPVQATRAKAYNDFATTPAELRRVGIFVSERSFATA